MSERNVKWVKSVEREREREFGAKCMCMCFALLSRTKMKSVRQSREIMQRERDRRDTHMC